MKRTLGFIFIALSAIPCVAVIALFPSLLKAVAGFFRILSGSLDSAEAGTITGSLIYWVLHFTLIVVFWKYGRQWIRRKPAEKV